MNKKLVYVSKLNGAILLVSREFSMSREVEIETGIEVIEMNRSLWSSVVDFFECLGEL
jgi:hypothetical protein